ncbi:hypothetical protein RF679_17895 [Undibacterium cyanobacteriorum]|uniref:Uncharacterized protein n=1 Tax=Undibacterium cyanobacteriorum TaxID=3073561 RepID=A0ABY9RGZ0_9BURK|nr:hypothetical protein [Undibacterium sp. 20NA77.5]WMW80489.1 hypothetical protein RF679_17895 [Undibacterium sp. 20NA77.5]
MITSLGGDLSEGVKIGNLLADRAMGVEVAGYCMSSCANNIFLAGRTKTLRPDSVVGFHGSSRSTHAGPSSVEQDDEEKGASRGKLIAQFDRMATEEAQLLQRLHLDPDILVEMMDRLENKLPPNEVHFVLTVNGKKIEIADGDGFDQRIKSALEEIASKEALKSVQLSRANPYGDAVFFPNQQTLESFGVTGIKAYFYPTDEKQLQQLEEQIKKRIGTSKLRFAGDFPEAE